MMNKNKLAQLDMLKRNLSTQKLLKKDNFSFKDMNEYLKYVLFMVTDFYQLFCFELVKLWL